MSGTENSAELRLLVEQLADPRTRRLARQKLVAARAVDTLIECLDSVNESVVWAAIQSLEELRAREAVRPLIDLLDRGILVVDVSEALMRITGQDFGADARRWRKWLEGAGGDARKRLDVAECVRRTGDYVGVRPTGGGDTYQFKLPLPDERKQKVAVFFGRRDPAGDQLVVIYSECGPANPRHYETLLRKNLSIPAGAFAIRDIKGKATVVMVDTMMASLVTPSALAKKIENIASLADKVEKGLTRQDVR